MGLRSIVGRRRYHRRRHRMSLPIIYARSPPKQSASLPPATLTLYQLPSPHHYQRRKTVLAAL